MNGVLVYVIGWFKSAITICKYEWGISICNKMICNSAWFKI